MNTKTAMTKMSAIQLIDMQSEQASKALGLPADVAWKMLNGGVTCSST